MTTVDSEEADSFFWPHPDAVGAPMAALRAAEEIASSSGQRVATPVRKGFVRRDDDNAPPLRALYVGGRSGIVAVKLYLALLWRCSRSPYETDKPARAWATLLGLEDPEGRGARRVAEAMKVLASSGLLEIQHRPGHPNNVRLLDDGGTGSLYEPPSTGYYKAEAAGDRAGMARNLYFRISNRLWTEGHLQSLKGPGTVMLLILLAEQADSKGVWFSTDEFPKRYKISAKTRAAGTAELEARGLLDVHRVPVASAGSTSVFDERRTRKIYRLVFAAVPPASVQEP